MLIVAISTCAKGKESSAALGLLELVCKATGVCFSKKKISRTKNKKPYFTDGYPEFSIAHTDGVACCCVQYDQEQVDLGNDVISFTLQSDQGSAVGIDIESCDRRITYHNSLAFRRFSGAERQAATSEREIVKIWTRKEAYLKFTGEGLSGLNKSDSFNLQDGTEIETKTLLISDKEYFVSVCRKLNKK